MGNNTALKRPQLMDFIFLQEELLEKNIPREEIYEIKDGDDSLGYCLLSDIKLLNARNDIDWTQFSLRQSESNEWRKVYDHPSFQRRRPQVIHNDASIDLLSEDDEYYILTRGQKTGPYTINEIKVMVNENQILVTDLISSNAGYTWGKIYQLESFDRRHLRDNSQLPGLPRKEIFDHNNNQTIAPSSESVEAMTGLAFLGNLKKGKAIAREQEEHLDNALKQTSQYNSFYKIILVGSLIGIIYLGLGLKQSLKSPFQSSDESITIGENHDASTDSIGTKYNESRANTNPSRQNQNENINQGSYNDSGRSNRLETRKLQPIRRNVHSRSFTQSAKFEDANRDSSRSDNTNNNNNPPEDQSYYYNDTAPMELDPVRSQVSKETTNAPEATPDQTGDPIFNQEVNN